MTLSNLRNLHNELITLLKNGNFHDVMLIMNHVSMSSNISELKTVLICTKAHKYNEHIKECREIILSKLEFLKSNKL